MDGSQSHLSAQLTSRLWGEQIFILYANQNAGRQPDMPINGAPEVQAVRMIIDVFGLGWVKLNYAFFIRPKQVFDEGHLLPIWRSPSR